MGTKHFWQSRTLWVNAVAILAIVANSLWGVQLDSEAQATMVTVFLAVTNLILRLITKQPISR